MLKRFTMWLDSKTLKELASWSKEVDRPVGYLVRKIVEEEIEKRILKGKDKEQ